MISIKYWCLVGYVLFFIFISRRIYRVMLIIVVLIECFICNNRKFKVLGIIWELEILYLLLENFIKFNIIYIYLVIVENLVNV